MGEMPDELDYMKKIQEMKEARKKNLEEILLREKQDEMIKE